MRNAFVRAMCELAESDDRVFLVTADLGWGALEPFANRFPERFLNVGIAEQNMLGVVAGLAREGFVPFAYSIATFASMRGYEQFRNGGIMHDLPVRVVGIGGGFAYGHAGPTHHALEDLTICRTQPGLTVLAPCDPDQTRATILATADIAGSVYLRVDKAATGPLPGLNGAFALDTPAVVRPGSGVLFLATGSIAHEAVRAADLLAGHGVDAGVAVMAHLGFAPSGALVDLLDRYKLVVTVEEGYTAGGLASLASEAVARYELSARVLPCGVDRPQRGTTGGTQFLRARHGLTAAALAAAVEREVRPGRIAA